MQLKFHHRTLQLRSPFKIARSTTTQRFTLIVELCDEQGNSGFGEVSDNTYYPEAKPHEIERVLDRLKAVLAKADPDKPQALWTLCQPLLKDNRFALSALDMAAHDLAARRADMPLYSFWGIDWQANARPVSNYTLSIGSPDEVLAQAEANPWPSYKVKLGGQADLETLQLLRDELPGTLLAVDANAAWEILEARAMIEQLSEWEIAFVEQPLPQGSYTEMVQLRAALQGVPHPPLIADEDCKVEADIDRCAGAFDGVNIKLTKCGGPTPALRMVARARELGLKVMFGCMVESSFGIGILQHLSVLADYVDLDGHMLISNDPGRGIAFDDDGRVVISARAGSGVTWRTE